ncbi:MAG: alpha/beta hydrolase [Pseudomonadales bacterium]|nr:alpha/beta hydrolase [Pseudomonadales bacterium]
MIKKILLATCALILVIAGAGYLAIDFNKQAMYQLATDLGAKEAGLVAKELKVKGHNVHYLENGLKDTKPTLLMVHGFGAFKENWIRMAIELKDDFHMVSIDLPGHGDSDYFADSDYDIDQQVAAIHEFAQQVIGRPFYMTGNSMGGAITALYSATYPKDILASVLLDPGHITDVESEFHMHLRNGVNPLIVENSDQFRTMVAFAMSQPPPMPWFIADVSTQKMAERKHKNDKIWIDITQNQRYDFKKMLGNITSPTTIAWGKEDRVLHYKNAYIFQHLIKNSTVEIMDNVGHAPMIEVPKLAANLMRQMLAK